MFRALVFLIGVLLSTTSCNRERIVAPAASHPLQVYGATTQWDGTARIEDESGATIFVAAAYDPSGVALPGLDVTFFGSSPEPLVAFNEAVGGEPIAMFAVTPGSTSSKSETFLDSDYQTGVFILNQVDIMSGRLYDPARDGFVAAVPNTLRSLRRVVSYDDLDRILTFVPGLTDLGEFRLGSPEPFLIDTATHFLDRLGGGDTPAEQAVGHRVLRFFTWANGRSPNYWVHAWSGTGENDRFAVPLGVRLDVTIDSPTPGQTFTGSGQRELHLSGRINDEPGLVTTDGGHVDLIANGQVLRDVLAIGGNGSGGTTFSSSLLLADGQNRIEVVAYVGEAGRGLATPPTGEAGRTTVTVLFQGPQTTAPVLSELVAPSTVPGPDGIVNVSLHFEDPDGDISWFHERMNGIIRGEGFANEAEGAVTDRTELEIMDGGTSGDCSFPLPYFGLAGGDWLQYEFWVVDGQGQSSNHVSFRVTIVE